LWLLLSGHFDPLLLSFGVASTIGVVLIALRMEVVDHEAVPLQVRFGFLGYLVWLAAEIAKSNIAVARIILNPKLPISPQMIRVKMSQKSDLGRVTYANSITLTPGTVSVEVEGDEILVHAITREMGEALAEGDMDRRVTAIEGT
jgi:multicomponent Na+:H+ antiporter subunit E